MISLSLLVVATVLAQSSGPLSSIPAKYLPIKPQPGKVVVSVNGIALTAKDVESLLWNWHARAAEDEIINYLVVKTEARRQSIRIPPQEVDAELNKQIKLYAQQMAMRPGQFPKGTTVDQVLEQQGMARSRLFMGVETQMLSKKLILRKFDASQFAKVATILVRAKSDQEADVQDAAKRAQAAYGELTQGAQWDQVLKTYTTDPNAIQMKGILGWRMVSVFPQGTRADLKKLKIGGYTKPAKTQFGYQIFRLDMRGKDATAAELDQLKDQYVLVNQRSFIADLRKTSKIVQPK